MRYHVDWVENKNHDWKIATLTDPSGQRAENVSINRINKKGEVFPNFDGIIPGVEIQGESWKSPAGKLYLFAPEVRTYSNNGQKSYGGAPRGSQVIAKAQEVKREDIKNAQENKELGIKVSSTLRMAVDLAIAEHGEGRTDVIYQDSIRSYRAWLWAEWEKDNKDFPPFN